MKRKQLISSDEAVVGKAQHVKPCSDCPMARTALPGWLGGVTAEEYCALSHSEATVDCHAINGTHCAGMAIYRANVHKTPRNPEGHLELPQDTKLVFASPMEFLAHHKRFEREAS